MSESQREARDIQKAEAQAPDRTDAGIHLGAEKYAKEDDPQDNPAYDPATGKQTGAGMPPSTKELDHRSKSDGKETIGHDPHGSEVGRGTLVESSSVQGPDEVTRRAVVPAPAPTRDHLIDNYPHVFPGLEKKAAAEAKAKEEAAEKAEEEALNSSSSSSSSSDESDPHDAEKKSDHRHHHKDHHHKAHHSHDNQEIAESDGHHHRGPLKTIAHVLHLDRHDRKVAKEQKKEEKAEMRERKRNIRKRNEQLEHSVSELTQTEDTSRLEPDETGVQRKKSVAEGGAVSDARAAHEAIPLGILNPEGVVRKEKEDNLLKNGGDFEDLAWRSKDEVKVPRDRIDNLIEREHARKKSGLPEPEEKDLKVAFHTADSFDSLDKVTDSSRHEPVEQQERRPGF